MKFFLSILITIAAISAQNDTQIETHELGHGIYMLVGSGGNIVVSTGNDGVFIVDDQYAPMHDKIVTAIEKISNAKNVRFVINTHWHSDHTGGNELLAQKGSLIIAHDNVRKTMSEPQVMTYFKSITPASPILSLPAITFSNEMTLNLNGDQVLIFHVHNAHTDGDSIVYFQKANIIHMGDTFFKGRYPFIDVEHGGSIAGIIATAEKVLEIADENTQIVPGHGSTANINDLKDYKNALTQVKNRIENLIKEGLTLEQILEKDCLADLNVTWGQGFMKPALFTEIVFDSLSPNAGNKE